MLSSQAKALIFSRLRLLETPKSNDKYQGLAGLPVRTLPLTLHGKAQPDHVEAGSPLAHAGCSSLTSPPEVRKHQRPVVQKGKRGAEK